MFTTSNNPFCKFISLLDTPSKYESGKLIIFDRDTDRLISVDLEEVPSLVDGVRVALDELLQDSDTIDFTVDDYVTAILKDLSVEPSHIKTTNQPQDDQILVYSNNQFAWKESFSSTSIIEVESKDTISKYQPVSKLIKVASNQLPLSNECIGLAVTDAIPNGPIKIQLSGELTNPAWNFPVGTNIYLGDGNIVTTPPNNGFVQKIGFAVREDTILIDTDPVVVLFYN